MKNLNKKNRFNLSKAAVIAITFLLVFSMILIVLPVTKAAGAITLNPTMGTPSDLVTITGSGFGAQKPVGIGFGAEVNVINEELEITGPYDVGTGPYVGYVSHVPFKPGSYTKAINVSSTLFLVVDTDNGNGTFTAPTADFLNGTLDYVTGKITLHLKAPIPTIPHYVNLANYTTYEYDVTPAAGVTTFATGTFQATITVPDVYNGDYIITAIDPQGNIATATLTVTGGQEPPATMWSKTYGGAGADTGAGNIVQTSDGGYAISGDTASFGAGNTDYWLIKTDADGNIEWNKTYGGPLVDSESDMCQTSDGGYALAGVTSSFGAGEEDFWLVKTDASGNLLWNKTYGGSEMDFGLAVVQTSDGGYAVAGITMSFGAGGRDAWLVKTDSAGNMQWNRTYGGTDSDKVYSLVATSDGGYALGGDTSSFGAGSNDFWILKTDSTGNMQWNKTYGGTGGDTGYFLVQTVDGGYAIIGYTSSFGAGGTDFWLVKTDSSGTMQWNQTYGGTGGDNGIHVTQTVDGGYAIIGFTGSFGAGGTDFWLVKTDSSGTIQWNQTHGGKEGDAGWSIIQTIDGGYALAGNTASFGAGRTDFWLIKTDELGGVPDYSWEWPMLGHNPQRTRYSASPAPSTNQILWNYTTGALVFSSCAVADGRVYVGSYDNNVYCLDAATGAKIWNYTTGGVIYSSPAVADGRVYVGSSDDNLYCFDAFTGDLLWNYTTGHHVNSSPAVADGRVYVGSQDNNTYCLDAVSGSLIWNFTAGGDVFSSCAVADGRVYVGSHDNNMYCLDAAGGTLLWNYTTGAQVAATPAVVNGRVYIGSSDNNVYCLDALTGAKIWNYTTSDEMHNPGVADGRVYVGSSDDNLYCFDAFTGDLLWNYTTGDNVRSSPAVADGKVYVSSFDRNVYCLDAATGVFIWSYTTGTGAIFYSSPVVANGVVYVGSMDRQIYAFSDVPPFPEGLTIGVMLLLSTVAVIVSARYFRKRPKWENWYPKKHAV